VIINVPDKVCLSDSRLTNISKSFAHEMAAKTSWHRYGTKLRHRHPMYIEQQCVFSSQLDSASIADNVRRLSFNKPFTAGSDHARDHHAIRLPVQYSASDQYD